MASDRFRIEIPNSHVGLKQLLDHPELVNDGPYEPGWLIKVSLTDATDLDNLMSADEYEAFLTSQE